MRKKMLHSWYIDEGISEEHGKYFRTHGVVTGHDRLPDSTWCHTSRVVEVQVDDAEGELVVQTRKIMW